MKGGNHSHMNNAPTQAGGQGRSGGSGHVYSNQAGQMNPNYGGHQPANTGMDRAGWNNYSNQHNSNHPEYAGQNANAHNPNNAAYQGKK